VNGFDTLLIANRGEIAMRIARSARALGIRTIAVVSDADRAAPHARACDDVVAIGGSRPADSYLRIDKLIDAARSSGAQAVHPGYGFLAENPAFGRAIVDAGLVFVGPPPAAIIAMGDKAAARQRAVALGVPVLSGYDSAAQDADTLRRAAALIGFPVMIKATGGGGGRGMRRVDDAAHFEAALASARSEAHTAFGDDRVIVERALRAPRHVEIQILADAHGNAVFLGERDCSVQRRHQKIIEEAPCPVLAPSGRRAMGDAALRLVRAIGYVGAGTVEFLHAGSEFFFMEMNTRLQVEHPVTEAVIGLDLVEWQLRIARGEHLAFEQNELLARFERGGHAIEARLCAEEPGADFMPRTGRIVQFRAPDAIRFDHAIEAGLEVSPFYDSLLGKAIAHAASRGEAARRLAAALDRTVLLGVPTNRVFLAQVLRHRAFLGDGVSTALIEEHFAGAQGRTMGASDTHWAIAAFVSTRVGAPGAEWPPEWNGWSSSGVQVASFRLRAGATELRGHVEGHGALGATVFGRQTWRIEITQPLVAGAWNYLSVDGRRVALFFARAGERIWVQVDGVDVEFTDLRLQPALLLQGNASAGAIAAAMHGRVVDVAVRVGQRVDRGAALATLEAMKMEHALAAPASGLVRAVHVQTGDQVAAGSVVIELDLDAPGSMP
jgi:geranyl-CoA carboxylase alpha subunit